VTVGWVGWIAMGAGLAATATLLVLVWQLRSAVGRGDDGGALSLLQQQLDALRGQLGQALAGQSQTVGQREGLQHRCHLVQPVRATAQHLEAKIDLGRR